ncbi:hypothetical protein [Lentzea sp. NPDC051838]|uniref:hypothetical protein n=1 Tax=Lentzea sp. NPDC051838 TaxID=3154849 RepID=UPI00344349AE
MNDIRLLPSDELLQSLADDVKEMRVRETSAMRKAAELERRGAAGELGYKTLAHVLRDAVRWDLHIARQWVANAGLLSSEITPTGNEIARNFR